MRLGDQGVGVLGIDTHHQAALTAGRDRHVAADEEGQASEHPLLGDVGFAGDQLADPVGEIFVVRHRAAWFTSHTGRRHERPIETGLAGPHLISLVRANRHLLDAALAGDDAVAEALGVDVVAGWATFTGALQPARDALAALRRAGRCRLRPHPGGTQCLEPRSREAGFWFDGEAEEDGEVVWRYLLTS
jgi:hypothetical protein